MVVSKKSRKPSRRHYKRTRTRRRGMSSRRGSSNEIKNKLNSIYGTDLDLPQVSFFSRSKRSKLIKNIKNKTRKLINLDKKIKKCSELINSRPNIVDDVKNAVSAYTQSELITDRLQNEKTKTKGYLPDDTDDDYSYHEQDNHGDIHTPPPKASVKRKPINGDLLPTKKYNSFEKRMANRHNTDSKSKSKSKLNLPPIPDL